MRNILITMLMITSLMFISTGCVTPANPTGEVAVAGITLNPTATGQAVEVAAQVGTLLAVQKDPSTKQYFQLSGQAINALIVAGNTSPTNLISAINNVDSTNKIVSVSVSGALLLYNNYYAQTVTSGITNQSPYTIPVLQGLAQGLILGSN